LSTVLFSLSSRKRAKFTWLSNRADIASKWTWLTAQISDLEYRIRQQTEFYRQIRAAKGAVTLGSGIVSWPPHARKPVTGPAPQCSSDPDVPLSCSPAEKSYSRTVMQTETGDKRIVIKVNRKNQEGGVQQQGKRKCFALSHVHVRPVPDQQQQPATSFLSLFPVSSAEDSASAADAANDPGSCRTRPIKVVRRRRILGTKNFFRQSARANKVKQLKTLKNN
jgi:hypothetical protein